MKAKFGFQLAVYAAAAEQRAEAQTEFVEQPHIKIPNSQCPDSRIDRS